MSPKEIHFPMRDLVSDSQWEGEGCGRLSDSGEGLDL